MITLSSQEETINNMSYRNIFFHFIILTSHMHFFFLVMWKWGQIRLFRKRPSSFFLQSPLFTEYWFKDFKIHESLKKDLQKLGLSRPTAIQAKAFVPVSAWRDATLCSQTGSGKTIAYLLPLLNRALIQQDHKPESLGYDLLGRCSAPAVVLCPTVELCRQVLSVAALLDSENRISKQTLADLNMKNVMNGPRIRWGGVDLVVSTPAKFAQDIDRFKDDLLKPSTVVLDEADMLLEGASRDSVMEILNYLRPIPKKIIKDISSESPPTRPPCQFVFVSATIPRIGNNTAGPMIDDRFGTAEMVQAGNFHAIPSNINSVEWVPELQGNWEHRCYLLTQLLQPLVDAEQRILVFVNSGKNVSALFEFLKEKKWPVKKFSAAGDSHDGQIVVATDLAARGIDWTGIDTVVNFQMPTDVVTWIHRAGRCGRIGRTGSVVSFYKEKEEGLVCLIKERVAENLPLEDLFSHKRSLRRKSVLDHPSSKIERGS